MNPVPGRPDHGRAQAALDACAKHYHAVRPQQPARMRPPAERFALAPDTVTAAGTVLLAYGRPGRHGVETPALARNLERIRPGPEGPADRC